MAVSKTVKIDGKQVRFKASAAIPRLYRCKFGRDIYRDLRQLQKSIEESDPNESNLSTLSLEIFENVAYIMAKHADAGVPDSVDEWLEQFNTFSIYTVLPELISLWGLNTQGTVTAKKNLEALTAK